MANQGQRRSIQVMRPFRSGSASSAGCMRPAGGFTLLEVLVAFAITALALVALVRGASAGLGSSDTATRTIEAVGRVQSLLAQVGVVSPLAPGETTGEQDGFRWRIVVTPVARQPGIPTTLVEAVGVETAGQAKEGL